MVTFTKKIKSLILVMLLFITGQVFAGAPTWTRVDYTSSTTFVGIVKIIQYTPTFGYNPVAGDYIGAFVGTECRMVAQIFANGSDLYVSSVIQGGDNCAPSEPNCTAGGSEKVTFRLWSNTGSKEYASIKGDTLTYPGSNIGSTTPYEIGKGKTGKDLLTLVVTGATLSPTFAPGTINYTATVSTLPVIIPANYTSSPNSTVTVTNATNLNGTLAERTTTIVVTPETGTAKTYTIVFTASCTTPTIVITPSATSICMGGTTTLTASGANSYVWSNGGNTAAITTSPTANITYTVTGTSAIGGCTATLTQAIVVNALPTVNAGTDASACVNTTLNLNATITGGKATYTYAWSPTTNLSNATIEDPSFNSASASATTYTLSVTDANGCKGGDAIVITANGIPSVTATANPTAICKGLSSTITAGGASSYLWSSNAMTSSVTVTPSATTTYSVTGTDVNGCKNTASAIVTINQSPTVVATVSASPICAGDPTTVSATGAVSFTWNPTTVGTVNPTATTIYTVTGTDAKGCKGTSSTTVTVNQLPNLQISATPTSTICIGSSTALSVIGANSYSWDNSTITTGNQTVSPLVATIYNVTGTDVNGCKNSTKTTISVNNLPSVSINPKSVAICNGNTTTLTANGGISYSWDNALLTGTSKTISPAANTTYNVTGTDANGCKNIAQSIVTVTTPELPISSDKSILVNQTIPSLTATGTTIKWYSGTTLLTAIPSNTYTPNVDNTNPGVYPYNVTNTVNGCESAPITVTFTISSCTVSEPTFDKTSQEICVGDALPSFTAYGTGIQWYNSSSALQTSAAGIFTPKIPGDYYASQYIGCEGPKAKVTFIENQLPSISASANPTAVCIGESTTLLALGASTYTWNTTAGIIKPSATSTYYVTGTDTKGCKNSASVTVVVNSLPTVSISTIPTSICIGASSVITSNGAVKYVWDNGLNNIVSNINPLVSTTYSVTGTDANGCIGTSSTVLTVNSLPKVTANATPLAICIGDASSVSVTGASSYAWDNNLTGTSTSVKPTGTTLYSVTGTDINGCKATSSISVTVNTLPTIIASANSSAICNGEAATISAQGATSYTWDNAIGSTISKGVSPIISTTYKVTGTDDNGCINTAQTVVTVTTPASPTITGQTTYTINQTITALNATGTLVKWYDNAGTLLSTTNNYIPTIDNTIANTITIKATNTENGCTSAAVTKTITVTNCSVTAPTIDKTTQSICSGGTFTAFTATGTNVKWYSANNSLIATTAGVFTPTKAGSYYATQTNICEGVSASVIAIINPLPTITATSALSAICNGNGTTISAQGASSYIWDKAVGSNASSIVSPTASTTYNVTGTDGNGCTNTASTIVTVTTPTTPVITGKTNYILNQTITALNATGTTVNWYDNTGTLLTTVPNNNYTPVLDNTKPNTLTIKATNTVNGCVSAATPVTIIISGCTVAAPTLNKTTQSICTGGTFTPFIATGTTVKWYDASNDSPISTTAGVFTPTKAGSYYATQTNVCEGSRANITAIENTLPVISINPIATLCLNDNAVTVTATPTGGSFIGTGITANGVFTPSTSGNFTITYNYTDTKSCSNSSTTTIKVNALPTVVASSDKQATCTGTSANISVSGAVSYIWGGVTGTVSTIVVSPTSTTMYTVTGTDVNGCKNKSSVILVVNAVPTIIAATTGATVCEGNTGVLTATGATGTINWYDSKSTGSIANTPSITVTNAGTYQVSQTVNGCESAKTDVLFIINKKPDAVTIPKVTINSGDAIPTIPAGTIVNWYDASKKIITTADSYVPTVSNTVITPTYYYIDVTSSAGCNSAMTSFIFEVKALDCPSAPTASVGTICDGETGIITAIGTNLKWYNVATGGTIQGTGNTYSVTAAGSYYVSESSISCISQRTKIDVVFTAKTAITIVAPATMKTTDAPVVITVNPIGGVLSGSTALNSSIFTPSIIGNNAITYTFTNGSGCISSLSKTIIVSDGKIDISALQTAISTGSTDRQNAIINSLVGSAVGQYPKTALDALNTAIDAAIISRDDQNATQASVNTATTTLNTAISTFEASLIKVGDKNALINLIATAQNKADNSSYGAAIGDIPSTAKADLLAAIATATAVKNDPTATQSVVDAAKAALQSAIDAFDAQKITVIYATSIKFNTSFVNLKIGESLTLGVTADPINTTLPALVWTSSDPKILTVDQNGKITCVGSGNATITVSFKNDPTKFAKMTITMTDISEVEANTPEVYPNITSDVLYVKKAGLVKSIQVIAINSKKVKEIKPKADVVILDVTDLINGTYYIVIEMEDGSIITKNIIKE